MRGFCQQKNPMKVAECINIYDFIIRINISFNLKIGDCRQTDKLHEIVKICVRFYTGSRC